jgi:formyl-CoA transferase
VLLNLNKKSVTLDIKSEKGRKLFIELIKKSDVLVENFGIQKMTEWGFSEEALNRFNPQLVYASITGYGSYGPYSGYPSLDMTAQAMSGIMSITGNPEDPPLRCGATVADSSGGTNLALGIVAALYRRERSGKGMRVEVSLQDSAVSLGRSLLGTHIAFGSQTPKSGNQLKDVVPWNIYCSMDGGFVAICVIDQSGFEKLMHAIGQTEIIEKFKLRSLQQRKKARDLIEKTVGDWVANRTKQDVMKTLCEQGIPCGAVLDTLEIVDDPHLNQRKMFVEITHHQWGRIRVLGCPVKFSDFQNEFKSSPELGKHNQEIYSGLLNLSETKIQELKETGVI